MWLLSNENGGVRDDLSASRSETLRLVLGTSFTKARSRHDSTDERRELEPFPEVITQFDRGNGDDVRAIFSVASDNLLNANGFLDGYGLRWLMGAGRFTPPRVKQGGVSLEDLY